MKGVSESLFAMLTRAAFGSVSILWMENLLPTKALTAGFTPTTSVQSTPRAFGGGRQFRPARTSLRSISTKIFQRSFEHLIRFFSTVPKTPFIDASVPEKKLKDSFRGKLDLPRIKLVQDFAERVRNID